MNKERINELLDELKNELNEWEPIIKNGRISNLHELITYQGQFKTRLLVLRKLLLEHQFLPDVWHLLLPRRIFNTWLGESMVGGRVYGFILGVEKFDRDGVFLTRLEGPTF